MCAPVIMTGHAPTDGTCLPPFKWVHPQLHALPRWRCRTDLSGGRGSISDDWAGISDSPCALDGAAGPPFHSVVPHLCSDYWLQIGNGTVTVTIVLLMSEAVATVELVTPPTTHVGRGG